MSEKRITALVPHSMPECLDLAKTLAATGLYGSAPQCLLKILAGRELGVGPISSLQSIHITGDGKLIVGAHIRAVTIRASGRYDFRITEQSDTVCAVEFLRKGLSGWEVLGVERLTLDEAKKKGWHLAANGKVKSPWEKTPKNMLFARCITNGYKFYCPDIDTVATYDPDEFDVAPTVESEFTPKTTESEPTKFVPAPEPTSAAPTAEPTAVGTPVEVTTPISKTISKEHYEQIVKICKERQRTTDEISQFLAVAAVPVLQKLPVESFEWALNYLDRGPALTAQLDKVVPLIEELKIPWDALEKRLLTKYQVPTLIKLNRWQLEEVIQALESKLKPPTPPQTRAVEVSVPQAA